MSDKDSFVSDANSIEMKQNVQNQFMAAPVSYQSNSESNDGAADSSDGYGQERDDGSRRGGSRQGGRKGSKKNKQKGSDAGSDRFGGRGDSSSDVISEESSGSERKQANSDDTSDVDSEQTVGFFDRADNSDDERISSESDEETKNTIIRVYDARFKIPDQTALGQMFAGQQKLGMNKTQAKQRYTRMLRRASWFKKFVSYTILVLMGVAMLINIVLYVWRLYQLTNNNFFVARFKVTYTEEIQFQEITTTRIEYFLYKNLTEGAKDADSSNNFFIVDDINAVCGFEVESDDFDENTPTDLAYVTLESKSRMTQIRDNIKSPYTLISYAFVLFSMSALLVVNTVYVPFRLKEHQIPIMFRSPQTNIFYDVTRVRIYFFLLFIMLSACIPHVIFYYTDHPCLHTYSQADFGINWTDYYQYSMLACVWVIMIPVILFALGKACNDSIRYIWYPIMIGNIVFVLMLFILSMIVVGFAIKGSSSYIIRYLFIANLGIVVYAVFANLMYDLVFSKSDLLRADDDEETIEY